MGDKEKRDDIGRSEVEGRVWRGHGVVAEEARRGKGVVRICNGGKETILKKKEWNCRERVINLPGTVLLESSRNAGVCCTISSGPPACRGNGMACFRLDLAGSGDGTHLRRGGGVIDDSFELAVPTERAGDTDC